MGNLRRRELSIYLEEGMTLPTYNDISRIGGYRRRALNPNLENYRSSVGGYPVDQFLSINVSETMLDFDFS